MFRLGGMIWEIRGVVGSMIGNSKKGRSVWSLMADGRYEVLLRIWESMRTCCGGGSRNIFRIGNMPFQGKVI
jgi:hypothetical protein